MHITQLKLLGFKSFVEPTDLLILPGLTGVVGPNGCGKSNLLEGLRWVMGESSYKAMRGGAMDDVIFSGTQHRPARNMAEVTITIDNSSRTAPAEFNDEETLEISRLIHRGEGSRYKVNGRDCRAKDVKLLFEDAATGARSHALVRQGQIGEIVNSKPQARRRILEDAAGIAGLHSRRHEAELRLNAAEDNLERIADLIGQMDAQLNSLKRQARQAERYKEISQNLRALEALALYLKWQASSQSIEKAETQLRQVLNAFAEKTSNEATELTKREQLHEAIKPLRLEEAKAAAGLERLTIARDTLLREEQQALSRQEELRDQLAQAQADKARDELLISEGDSITKRLKAEILTLNTSLAGLSDNLAQSQIEADRTAGTLQTGEEEFNVLQAEVSTAQATRQSLERDLQRQSERAAQFLARQQALSTEQAALVTDDTPLDEQPVIGEIGELEIEIAKLGSQCETDQISLETERRSIDTVRHDANEAALKLKSLDTEIGIIETLLAGSGDQSIPSVVEAIETKPGFEKALWAALGDDLDVPLEITPSDNKTSGHSDSATAFWRETANPIAAQLPSGVQPLIDFISAPPALTVSLSFIGIVSEEDAASLQSKLKPGQKLVSKSGGLWRWDGFVSLPDAPSSLPRRLIERNRLPGLLERREALLLQQGEFGGALSAVEAHVQELQTALQTKRGKLAEHQQSLKQLYQTQRALAQRLQSQTQKQASLDQALEFAATEHREALKLIDILNHDIAGLACLDESTTKLYTTRERIQKLRLDHQQCQVTMAGLLKEESQSQQRIVEMTAEYERWSSRTSEAKLHVEALTVRTLKLNDELSSLSDLPQQFVTKRQKLLDEISNAERSRNHASDELAEAEMAALAHDKALKLLSNELIEIREDKARIETRLENSRAGFIAISQTIQTELNVQPEDCLSLCPDHDVDNLPPVADVEADANRLKIDREKLGAVNLRAAQEIKELEESSSGMITERDDLVEAVSKLRRAVSQLNEEGRQRLMTAFDVVNGHFKRLFQTLFSGGEAELKLVDSDDPLEAGLEIIARPPGKRPQVLTLLSGGEKALTAMSLIFAVFLTNPSPICVLDEVDAPLDDTNVDRFCNLMEDMRANTDTRFLVITHHPVTMERMDRLFGVTMSEKGVSQLVSVDLATAEGLLEEV